MGRLRNPFRQRWAIRVTPKSSGGMKCGPPFLHARRFVFRRNAELCATAHEHRAVGTVFDAWTYKVEPLP